MREQRTATWAWADPEWRFVARREGESQVDVEGAENIETDADGWVYGDNKWESHSGKGGLGKVRVAFSFLFSSVALTLVTCLVSVHALPPLDAHRRLDGEHGTHGTWAYGRLA